MARSGAQGWTGRLAALLATLALVLQVAVPTGFMVADTSRGASLVICTGHGPLQLSPADHGTPSKTPASKRAGACVFAGHGAAPLTPAAQLALAARFEACVQPVALRFDLAPGRGLAAPPPPSQGPPAHSDLT